MHIVDYAEQLVNNALFRHQKTPENLMQLVVNKKHPRS